MIGSFAFFVKSYFKRIDEYHEENKKSIVELENNIDKLRGDHEELSGQIQNILGRMQQSGLKKGV